MFNKISDFHDGITRPHSHTSGKLYMDGTQNVRLICRFNQVVDKS